MQRPDLFRDAGDLRRGRGGKQIQPLRKHPRDGELGDGAALLCGELLTARKTHEILMGGIAFDCERIQQFCDSCLICALDFSGHQTAGQAGVGDDRHLGAAVPRPRFFVIRSCQGDAVAAPGILHLLGQAEIRTGDGETVQAVRCRVIICFADPRVGPVGDAENADLPGALCLVQCVDEFADRGLRVVPVQQINVDVVRLQCSKAFCEFFLNHRPVDQHVALLINIAALAEHDHTVPVVPLFHPVSEADLGCAVSSRAVKTVQAVGQCGVQQVIHILAHQHRHVGGSEELTRNRLADSLDPAVFCLQRLSCQAAADVVTVNGCIGDVLFAVQHFRRGVFHTQIAVVAVLLQQMDQFSDRNDTASAGHAADHLSVHAGFAAVEGSDHHVL